MSMIPLFKVHMPPREVLLPLLGDVLYSGYITQGAKVDHFETELGEYFRNRRVITVNSGTSALQLALRLSNVKGREVITTPMTCSATVLPVLAEGARPVWADIDPITGNIRPDDVGNKITANTAAILAVHWGGQPCDMTVLSSIASHYNIPLIVDAAHALGAEWDGNKVGHASQADFTCFSLQAIKHITTGDGGILTVRSEEALERGKRLRWFGIDRTANNGDARVGADIPEWGYKFHMNDIAATIGLSQMHFLPRLVSMHRANAKYYDTVIRVPRQATYENSMGAWWLYTLLWNSSSEREAFMRFMKSRDIQVSRVHARLDKLTAFREFSNGPLPGVDEFFETECCIPVHWGLTEQEREYIAESVNKFAEK